jgi:capsular polysaccharide biosynthesis protein
VSAGNPTGQVKVLMPAFLSWAYSTIRAFGIRRRQIVSIRRGTIRCKDVLISDTRISLNTFLPNPEFCKLPAKVLGVDTTTRWTSRDAGSRIYLSRENQNNLFPRGVENEEELRSALRALGFITIEPANMAFHDLVHAINSASLILGAHGSGFGNLIFARRHGRDRFDAPGLGRVSWCNRRSGTLALQCDNGLQA